MPVSTLITYSESLGISLLDNLCLESYLSMVRDIFTGTLNATKEVQRKKNVILGKGIFIFRLKIEKGLNHQSPLFFVSLKFG